MIRYGISVLANNTLGLMGVLIVAYFIGALTTTLAMSIVLLALRPHAGGAHCSSSLNCNLFGYVLLPLFGYGALWLSKWSFSIQTVYLMVCAGVGLIWISLKAPFFVQSKPRAEVKGKKLKVRALMLASFIFSISLVLLFLKQGQWALGLASGLLFQGLSLSPLGVKTIEGLDNFVNRNILSKGGEPE